MRKRFFLRLLVFILILLLPKNNVRAEQFSCTKIDGSCKSIDAPSYADALAQCKDFCKGESRVVEGENFEGCVPSRSGCTAGSASSSCTFNGRGDEICSIENPIQTTEVTSLIKTVISAVLGIIGSFALLMLVWGGFQWLTSAGNAEKVDAGTKTMVWALIGVMVVLASYFLLSTFLDFLTGKQ